MTDDGNGERHKQAIHDAVMKRNLKHTHTTDDVNNERYEQAVYIAVTKRS